MYLLFLGLTFDPATPAGLLLHRVTSRGGFAESPAAVEGFCTQYQSPHGPAFPRYGKLEWLVSRICPPSSLCASSRTPSGGSLAVVGVVLCDHVKERNAVEEETKYEEHPVIKGDGDSCFHTVTT